MPQEDFTVTVEHNDDRAEAERDDERMRDPAEVAAAREYQRESLEDR